jgi:hypothetical protein
MEAQIETPEAMLLAYLGLEGRPLLGGNRFP